MNDVAAEFTPSQMKAFRLFVNASPYYDVWDLMGRGNNGKRAEILSMLEGKPMPVGLSSVTAVERKLFELLVPYNDQMSRAVARDMMERRLKELLK